ncbi:G2/mitotic-specific cyclin S13-7 [Cornus florida]|uniref:G2/mitotic-specific cyclin S13-7 n=1 Tax=Cornus florida TaxID=4283 RepID=UPI00289CAF36|nr:G2/mitotic-specific cyclin S13-7 [Cornus florida]
MASKAVLTQQPKGGGKLKNGQAAAAEGRNRRVLRDIGNLVTAPAVEGKPQAPISRPNTKSTQVAAAEKKPLTEIGIAVNGKNKETDKLKPSTVIGLKSHNDHHHVMSKEEKQNSGRKSRAGFLRKPVNTLTSILTARSKAACGLTNKPKDPISDIDAVDADDELAVVEYVEDIYKFYKLTEVENRVHDYMVSQPDINSKMRTILVDWLIEVHRKFELMPETLYLTINIVDRYLSMDSVSRRELQLVGISSMLIACKYEEIWAPEVNDFVAISDNAYVREQILLMEKAILGKLEWYLTVPTPYVFVVRYIKASSDSPHQDKMEKMVFFLAELGLMHYTTSIMYSPSMLAASAVYAARCTLNKSPLWTETLKHHTGYSEDQLMDCAKLLVCFHSGAADSKLKAVYRKFSSPDGGAVALFPAAKSLLLVSSLGAVI